MSVQIKNDIELSSTFSTSIADDYQTALEFITLYPDYSLVKFREVVSGICKELVSKTHEFYEPSALFDQINLLYEQKVISKSFLNNLHEVRKLGNAGAHKPINASTLEDRQFLADRKSELTIKAKKARELIVTIFKDAYEILIDGHIAPKIELVQEGMQEYKEVLFKAATSICDQDCLKAGVIYESQAEEVLIFAPVLVSNDLIYHLEMLHKQAANCFEAAYKISAKVDDNFRAHVASGGSTDVDDIVTRYCKLEPLFKYSVIAYSGRLGKAYIDSGFKLMKAAADRDYSAAQAYLGAILYDDKKDFELSKIYLDRAAEKDEPMALRYLFYFYSEGTATSINKESALEYLNKAISLGCPDSLGTMGEAYHKGIVLEKNDSNAKKFLTDAINAGSHTAKQYFIVEFNNIKEKVAARMQEIGKALLDANINSKAKPIQNLNKVGANSDCPCGSGKKYKKCCRDASNIKQTLPKLLPF